MSIHMSGLMAQSYPYKLQFRPITAFHLVYHIVHLVFQTGLLMLGVQRLLAFCLLCHDYSSSRCFKSLPWGFHTSDCFDY